MSLCHNKLATLLALCALSYWPISHAQQCGQRYQIASGDTLSAIAARLYQSPDRWLEIYEFRDNSTVIGSNPNLLRTQTAIDLPPCGDAVESPPIAPLQTVADPDPDPDPTPSPTAGTGFTAAFTPTIEVVTGGDYAPFTDQGAPGGGMLTQVVSEAMACL